MTEGDKKQILLLAPALLGESLTLQFSKAVPDIDVVLRSDLLKRHPDLIIWSLEHLEFPEITKAELKRLSQRWKQAPILLLLPSVLRIKVNELLDLECEGMLQDPDVNTLKESILTLLSGGRVIKLKEQLDFATLKPKNLFGLRRFLITAGIEQINHDINILENLLNPPPKNLIIRFTIKGRKRELNNAKKLLTWLWGPVKPLIPISQVQSPLYNNYKYEDYPTDIVIPQRDSDAVIQVIVNRLRQSLQGELINTTGKVFAYQGLLPKRKRLLMLALVSELNKLIIKIKELHNEGLDINEAWSSLQVNLRKESIRKISDDYTRLNYQGGIVSVLEQVNDMVQLEDIDDEMPPTDEMLDSLILNKPLNVEGCLIPCDHPKSLIKLEILLTNWLLRTADIVSSELLNVCSDWSTLRLHLLKPELISTRELERLRNELNTQRRIQSLITRPLHLYESKRLLYRINKGNIENLIITEPRDEELKDLGWLQKQVTLLVEARDALSPQIQSIVKYLGDLIVVLLTNVLGRAIGLIGKGIAQGMGRTISR